MKTLLRWLSLAGLTLAAAAPLAAQGRVALKARFDPATAAPGQTVRLVLHAEVEAGYHAYGKREETNIPVSLPLDELDLGGLEVVGEPVIPDGEPHEVFGMVQYPLPEQFEVALKVKVPAANSPGEVTVKGRFHYQVCDENSCDPPDVAPFTASLKVEQGEQKPVTPPTQLEPEPFPALPGMEGIGDDKVTLTARFDPAVARAGETVQLVLEAQVVDGWHAYGKLETTNIPVSLPGAELDLGGLEAAGEPDIPDGEPHEVFGVVQYPLPQAFEVRQAVKVPAGAAPGWAEVQGRFHYQLCDENSCDQPADVGFTAKLVIAAGAARAEFTGGGQGPETGPAGEEGPEPPANVAAGDDSGAAEDPFGGIWGLILACIGGGLFALAMPCTYPMIPITFSFFTKQAERRGGNVLPLALVYGLGIITIFIIVGVALSAVILPIVNHWLTNLVIGGVFLFFAFVLFGWVNFQPPRFLQDFASKSGQAGGLLGVFFMGAALVISSFTCTAPIVGTLIAKVAVYGPLRVGFGMAVFGLTMAIPFVMLALMPTKVKAMPRSGEWMETLKISLGFVELAAVLKFASMIDLALGWQVLNRELFLLFTAAIMLLWAMFLFGFLRKAGEPYIGVSAGRQGTGMVVVMLAVYLLSGAMGHRLDWVMTGFAPGYSAEFVLQAGGGHAGGNGGDDGSGQEADSRFHTIVYDDRAKAVEVAQQEDKLLLYNFTGFN